MINQRTGNKYIASHGLMFNILTEHACSKVPPEVEVITSHSKVVLGGSTTLFCNVTRTNPDIPVTYIWINENTGESLSEQSDTLLLNFSSVNDFGTYSCTVTNNAGEVGRGNVTITQGCKFTICTGNHTHCMYNYSLIGQKCV